MRFSRTNIFFAMTVAALACGLVGCAAAPRATPLCSALPPASRDGAAFWAQLAEQPLATNDDALHAILLFLDDGDDSANFDARVESLRSRGVLPASFSARADEAVTRGTVAIAITKMLGIRGGITMSLLGAVPRYAIRELEFAGLFPSSTPNQIFTGGELVAVMDRLYSHVAGDPAEYPASVTRAQMMGKGRIVVPHQTATTAMLETLPANAVPLYLSIGFTLAQPATASATTAAATAPSSVFVIAQIEAKRAEVRLGPESDFVPCELGMQLSAGSSIRTDLKGMVWVESGGQRFRAGGATVVKLSSLVDGSGVTTTEVEMPHGTINLDLERGGPSGNTTLRSPNTTLAVRGTKVSLYDQRGFEPRASSITGTAEFDNFQRRKVLFGKPRAPVGSKSVVVTAGTPDPAAVAFAQTVVDPTLAGARTDSEQQLVAQLLSRGSVVSFDRNSGLLIVRGGSVPTNFSPFLRGNLDVVLNWQADVNLNLGVASPGTDAATPPRPAEFVYPAAGLARTPNGGLTRFDHRGGSSGGYEVVSFARFDNGSYGAVVENVNPKTPQPINATFRVFLDGQLAPFTVNGEFFNSVTEFSVNVGPQSPSVTLIDDIGGGFIFAPTKKASATKSPAMATPTAATPTAAGTTGKSVNVVAGPVRPTKPASSGKPAKR